MKRQCSHDRFRPISNIPSGYECVVILSFNRDLVEHYDFRPEVFRMGRDHLEIRRSAKFVYSNGRGGYDGKIPKVKGPYRIWSNLL